MKEREEEMLKGSPQRQAARDTSADDLPIVILPDDMDLEDLENSLPEPPPAPEPRRPAILRKVPARRQPSQEDGAADQEEAVAAEVQEVEAAPEVHEVAAAAAAAPAAAARTSSRVVEEEINEELTLQRAGILGLFSMPSLCRYAALAAIALLGLLLYIGWDYYRLPLVLRPLHHLHRLLRPSGLLGLSLGMLAVLVMLSSLAYIVRKGMVSLRRMGSLQSWMGFHVLTGLLGPAVALYHAAFVPTSALGLFAVSAMAIVIASGMIGRYIAVYFPRSLNGREFKFDEIRARLAVYRRKLSELGVDPALLGIEEPESIPRTRWFMTSIAAVVLGDWESRKEFQRLKAILESKGELRLQTEMILFLIKRLCRERQWLVRYGEFRNLVGTWRFLHRWLAIVLFVALFFHIIVGLRFGELWIFGGRK